MVKGEKVVDKLHDLNEIFFSQLLYSVTVTVEEDSRHSILLTDADVEIFHSENPSL